MDKDMGFLLGYDSTNPKSLEEYAQKLIGHTFNEVNEWNLTFQCCTVCNRCQVHNFLYG